MRKLTCVALALLLVPSPAFAWGAVAHRYLTAQAIEILPPDIKPFFVENRDELVLRSNDPDLWRVVGFDDEPPNHQIDLGVEDYGRYPFMVLPRDLEGAIQKFGVTTLRRHGLLPWRITEEFGNLVRMMQAIARGQLYAGGNTVLFTATLAHYIEDATEPFHVTNNFDGQLTGQSGIHSRFESELFERFRSRLSLAPPSVKPVTDASGFIWPILLDAHQLAAKVLDADKAAIGGSSTYDDEYFEKFLTNVRPVFEKQLSLAVSATASAIAGAWELAGRPKLREVPRPLEHVRPR